MCGTIAVQKWAQKRLKSVTDERLDKTKGTQIECLSEDLRGMGSGPYLPMQKWEKMESRRSSVTTSPITSPIAAVASRRS